MPSLKQHRQVASENNTGSFNNARFRQAFANLVVLIETWGNKQHQADLRDLKDELKKIEVLQDEILLR